MRLRVCEKISWFRGGSCVCGGDICGQQRDRGGLLGRRVSLRRDVEVAREWVRRRARGMRRDGGARGREIVRVAVVWCEG